MEDVLHFLSLHIVHPAKSLDQIKGWLIPDLKRTKGMAHKAMPIFFINIILYTLQNIRHN